MNKERKDYLLQKFLKNQTDREEERELLSQALKDINMAMIWLEEGACPSVQVCRDGNIRSL